MSNYSSVLFLDYDGVLHPADVYYIDEEFVLKGEYAHFGTFCWTPILERIVHQLPDLEIILSTSWCHRKSFEFAKGFLPGNVRAKISRATFRLGQPFELLTRYQQIQAAVEAYGIQHWIAIDNDAFGWPEEERHRLVKTHDDYGIGQTNAQQELVAKLTKMQNGT